MFVDLTTLDGRITINALQLIALREVVEPNSTMVAIDLTSNYRYYTAEPYEVVAAKFKGAFDER